MLQIFFNNNAVIKPSEKIPILLAEIEKLKTEVINFISEVDIDIEALSLESEELRQEMKVLILDMEMCVDHIENQTICEISNSMQEYDRISNDLLSINYALKIIFQLSELESKMRIVENFKASGSFHQAVDVLIELMNLLNKPISDALEQLDIYKNLKTTVMCQWEDLLTVLSENWTRMVCWSEDIHQKKQIVTVQIKFHDSENNINVLNALDTSKQLRIEMSKLANFVLTHLLQPIVHKPATVVTDTATESLILTIRMKNQNAPSYEEVLTNMRDVFEFFRIKLDVPDYGGIQLMTILGDLISNEFSDILTKDCLVHTIPNCISELQSYGKVTSEIENFQKFLTDIGFFRNDDCSILQYANNVDVLFATKTTQYFLESARTIMKKDLSATIAIGVERTPDEGHENKGKLLFGDITLQEALLHFDNCIPSSPFYFPRCMISKSTRELLDLVYLMMEQAGQGSDLCCNRLYYAARNIFELYEAIVPKYHEKFLQTIPQYVALFYNNCMYLAHSLLTLGEKWSRSMNERSADYTISFLDQIRKLRDVGCRHLTMHMQLQRKQLLDNIRSSDLSCIVLKDVLSNNAEQAIRQCLRQLQLLKNVWINVFPLNVFTRLMTCLVNMFVEEIIHRVCTVEDISAEMATQLTDIYTIVINKMPQVFQDANDVEENVAQWTKLHELVLVLSGSLKDIEIRWGDGSGPLAIHFRPNEIRCLIKALFQNTQFRANLLSKIK